MVTVEPAWARTIVLFGLRKSTTRPPGPLLPNPEAASSPRRTADALGVSAVSDEMLPPSVPGERERERRGGKCKKRKGQSVRERERGGRRIDLHVRKGNFTL